MEFCEKCDNFLKVKKEKNGKGVIKKTIYCSSCGHQKPFMKEKDAENFTISQKMNRTEKDKTAVLTTTVSGIVVTEDDREAIEWLFESTEE